MMRNLSLMLLACCILINIGCAAKQTLPIAKFDKSRAGAYPPISIVVNDGYVNSSTNCVTGGGCYYYRNNDDKFILSALRSSTLFQRVDINNPYSELVFQIKFADFHEGSDSVEFAKLMVYAGTLGVIPTSTKQVSTFEVAIRYRNTILKTYTYEAAYTQTSSILIDPQSYSENAVNYFVSQLLKDLESDRLLIPEQPEPVVAPEAI